MRKVLIVGFFLLVSGCENLGSKGSLMHYLAEDAGFDGITFVTGPWYAPESQLAFSLTDEDYSVVFRNDDGRTQSYAISLQICSDLSKLRDQLISAIGVSVEVAIDRKSETGELDEMDEIVFLDGSEYALTYYSVETSTAIGPKGGDNAGIKVPWINAAWAVVDQGRECNDG